MYCDVRGARTFVATGGRSLEAAAPALLFVHGSGLDHTFWALHARYFAFRGYTVLAPDLPGHSLSAGEPLASVEDMADWLDDLLRVAGVREVSFVGHSQGCLVGLEFAARHPRRLRSLSLVASGLATPVNPVLIEAAKNEPDRAVALMTGWGFGPAGKFHLGPVPGNAMLANGQRVMRANAPAALAADLQACDAYRNGARAAAAIACPVQVLIGGRDRMAPTRATDELVAALENPEVHRIPSSGHMLPVEAPDLCRAYLRQFIFRHHPPAGA